MNGAHLFHPIWYGICSRDYTLKPTLNHLFLCENIEEPDVFAQFNLVSYSGRMGTSEVVDKSSRKWHCCSKHRGVEIWECQHMPVKQRQFRFDKTQTQTQTQTRITTVMMEEQQIIEDKYEGR